MSTHSDLKVDPVPDIALAALAGRQHGVVSHRQLIQLGFGRAAIQRRVRAGRLHALHRGVYAAGHPHVTVRGRWIAALMAIGSGAVLSHRSAAAVWDLRDGLGGKVDVTAPGRGRRPRPGIARHQVRELADEDVARRDGLPVTSVARTLLDLGDALHPAQLARTFERADQLRILDFDAVERLLTRAVGRRGAPVLAKLTVGERAPSIDTRSVLERRFVALCRDGGLPAPALNVTVAGYEVDAVWFADRLVVELDGYRFHRSRRTFEADRVRDATLQLAGFKVLRVTHRRLEGESRNVLEMLRSAIGAREPPGAVGAA